MRCVRALAGLFFAWGVSAQSASQPTLRWLSQSLQKLTEQVSPSVVQVVVDGLGGTNAEAGAGRVQTQRAGGSGVIVDPAGFIITNAHVVGTSSHIRVLVPEGNTDKRYASVLKPAGKLVDAAVVGMDRETDIAVLKVELTGLPSLKLGDSGALRQGELVLASGSPYGLQNSVTMGVVSSVARQIRPDDPMIYIQTDAPINPGNSGGPLLNVEGEVIGINTFIFSESGGNLGVGFAAPSAIVRTVYEQIRKFGRVRRGQVGLVVQTITPAIAKALQLPSETGAVVADVTPGGPAAVAGIEIKDVILTLDGKVIENARQFGVNIYQKAGQTVTLDVLRRGQKQSIQVAVLERPKDPDRLLSLLKKDQNLVPRLAALATELDENTLPLMPNLRRFNGVVIVATIEAGPAAAAGLLPGDVIYELNNQPIRNLKELMAAGRALTGNQPIVLLIERSGQLQFVEVDID